MSSHTHKHHGPIPRGMCDCQHPAPASVLAGMVRTVEAALSSQDLLEGPQLLPSPGPAFQSSAWLALSVLALREQG